MAAPKTSHFVTGLPRIFSLIALKRDPPILAIISNSAVETNIPTNILFP